MAIPLSTNSSEGVGAGVFEHDVHLFGVCLNFTFLFRGVRESHVYLFGVCLNFTYTYSECV